MSLTLRIGLIVLSLIFIVYVFNNVNKRKLQLQFSLIWLLIALAIIVIAVFPQIVYFAAKFIGIEVSSNLVYLIAIITLMFILINLTMKISKMSSGMMAKGKAALALSRDASLIMLDEPLNGIDIIARDQILETIQKYCSPTKTFLVSSHLVDDLERMTDDAIFMKNGGLVMCGKVDELTKHHGKTMTELYKEVYSDCVM